MQHSNDPTPPTVDLAAYQHLEAALQQSEALYRTLIDALDVSFCRWLPDTTLTFTNAKYRSIFGVKPEDEHQPWINFLPAETREATATFYRELAEKPRTVTYEHPVTVEDGSKRHYQWIDSPIFDSNGQVVEFQSLGIDITERFQNAALIMAQRDLARVASTVESQDEAWSRCLEIILRLTEMDSGGIYLFDTEYTGLTLVYHQGLGEPFVESVKFYDMDALNVQLLLSGQHLFVEEAQLTDALNQQEGIRSVAVLPFDHQGRAVGCINIASHSKGTISHFARHAIEAIVPELGNIIVYLRTQEAIRRSERQLHEINHTLEERVRQRSAEVQDLYDYAPIGYHSLDANGIIVRINETHLNWLGYTRDEIIGQPVSTIMSSASIDDFEIGYQHFLVEGSIRNREAEMVRKDGSMFPVLISATAIYNEQGEFVMSRSTVFDNTSEKQAADTLRRANAELARAARTKDEFLANMSHELRTPLNAILALSESLLEQIRGPLNERQQGSLRSIESSGRHLLSLINDILDLSKIEAGYTELQIETVQIATVCQASFQFIREMATKKSLTLGFQLNDQLAVIQADALRLKQMLVNLLSNAVKFTPTKGRVILEVTNDTEAGIIYFAVEDTGIGIAEEDIERLFHPFTQLDSSLNRQHEGTGLGLALVHRLCKLHGGDITVTSQLGKGTRFTIALPADPTVKNLPQGKHVLTGTIPRTPQAPAKAPMPRPTPPTPPQPIRIPPEESRILLAEDNETNRIALEDYLQARGYNVFTAFNGREAIERAGEIHPHLILMDIQMPEVDGIEAIRHLRTQPDFADTPIVALTALAMAGDRERCIQAGADAYITKPVNLKGLMTLMEQFLTRTD